MTNNDPEKLFRQRLGRVEALLQQVEEFADPEARSRTREVVQTVLELHAAGLARMLDHVATTGEAGPKILDALAADGLVSSLLVLHGLHPLNLETRVRRALDRVEPQLRQHARTAELVEIVGDRVQVRLGGKGSGCSSSLASLRRAVEDAIYEDAPDVTDLVIEDPTERPAATFVPVEELSLRVRPPSTDAVLGAAGR